MENRRRLTLFLGFFLCSSLDIDGFCIAPPNQRASLSISVLKARRYGPPSDDQGEGDSRSYGDQLNNSLTNDGVVQERTRAIRNLIQKMREISEPQHVPSLLTRNLDLLLSFSSQEMSACLDAIRETESPETAEETEEIIDIILSFAQDFCDETARIYDVNRQLLGRIITAMSDTAADNGLLRREEALDNLLANEWDNLTPGFLRHLAGECERIESAPKVTPESLRLLESLRVIQARVVDEMGRDLGEPAQVIMQLLGYDSKGERIAVLEAGLVVRGLDFATELLAVTDEALRGFQVALGDVDSELVERVKEVNDRTRQFIRDDSALSKDFQ